MSPSRRRKSARTIKAALTVLKNELAAVLAIEAGPVVHSEQGDRRARDHIRRLQAGIDAATQAIKRREPGA
jgi:hypothetical protein